MKRYLAIFVLVSILLQTFNKVIIVIHFELNQDYIAKNLCENRDKPAMHCCGKCQLKKKLAEENEKQKLPVFPDNKSDVQYFGESLLIITEYCGSNTSIFSKYADGMLIGTHHGIFHPPTC